MPVSCFGVLLGNLVEMKTKFWFYCLAIPIIIVFDQWTKLMVVDHFQHLESLNILTNIFSLTYIRNTGAAFGMLAQADPTFRIPFFLIIPMVAMVVLGFLYRDLSDSSKLHASALGLITGGAIGNLIDRVRLGYVVDFLDVHYKDIYHWPAFNVADTAICVGVGILIVFSRKKQEG